jgi:hypothetical protein
MAVISRKDDRYIISKKNIRKPLFGYYDAAGISERKTEVFDPSNNERQASQLIDLPTALTRGLASSVDSSEDKRFRYRDPYSDRYKNRLLNAWYMDAVINEAIIIRCSHILGKGMRTILQADPYVVLGEEKDPKQILDDIISENEQNDLMTYIKKVERLTQIYEKYERLCIDNFVGGRSGQFMMPANKDTLAKYELPEGTPAFLVDLEWNRLGQVILDNNDRIAKIEYRDPARFPVPDNVPEAEKGYGRFLPYNEMIYFTRNEKYYGRSIIQTILAVSEQNRMMNEQDLPEITKARWAPSMLFWSDQMSKEELEDFIDDRDPAKDSAVRAEIHSEVLQTDANPEPLWKLRESNARFMIMQLDVPSFMMKMEDVTNRATAVSVLSTWRNLTLENDRERFRQMMWHQFYKKLVILWFRQSDPEFDIIDWDARVGFVFDSLSVTDDESEAKVVDILQKHGIESMGESRRRMNLPAVMEEIDAIEDVLDNNQNAEEAQTTRDEVQDQVGEARDDLIALMKKKGMPSDMIGAAEDIIRGNTTPK